jgi:hypothetical protein
VPDQRTGVERLINAVDGVLGLLGGVVVVGFAVVAIRAGGTAGLALGAGLLLVLAGGLVGVIRRHR